MRKVVSFYFSNAIKAKRAIMGYAMLQKAGGITDAALLANR